MLLASRSLVPDFPLLVPMSFLSLAPLHGMTFPFLSNRNHLWTPCFPLCAAIFLHLSTSVLCLLCVNSVLYGQYYVLLCGCLCGCGCACAYNAQVRIVSMDNILHVISLYIIKYSLVYTLLNILLLLDYDLHNVQSFHDPSLSLFIIKLTLDHL